MIFPRWRALLPVAAAAFLAAPLAARGAPPAAGAKAQAEVPATDLPGAGQDIQASPPPFTEGIFPCSQCHDKAGDPTPRELAFHDEIQASLHHGPPSRWCLDCHSNAKRDYVHLINGTLVPFTESYKLCGQCHGDKYRDWRLGVHGKRVGMWNGKKTYYLCVNCHNPHNPRFKALKPEPPPIPPQEQGR
jgi:Doubled CXXCH motif (Paired_CXXCH_1)